MREQAIIEYGKELQSFLQEREELLKTEDTEQNRNYIERLKQKMSNLYVTDENENPIEIQNPQNSPIQFKPIGLRDKKYRQILKKGVSFIKVFTKMESNRFIVTILDAGSSYKKGRLFFLTSSDGGKKVVFEYSCEDDKWKPVQEDISRSK